MAFDVIDNPATLHSLALDIADHTARSEVELYSAHSLDDNRRHVFDTAKASEESVDPDVFLIVEKAIRYIELRGDALPYRLRRRGTLVWFEERPRRGFRTV